MVLLAAIGAVAWYLFDRGDDTVAEPTTSATVATTSPSDEATVDPTEPTNEPTDQATEPTDQPTDEPAQPTEPTDQPTDQPTDAPPASNLPIMPSQVGEYTPVSEPESEFAMYSSPDGVVIFTMFIPDVQRDMTMTGMETTTVGQWLCTAKEGEEACAAEVYDGTLLLGGGTVEEMVAFGDEFLTLWV
ncbi:hypothetical protein LKO27_11385 [Tessaracoccus sp. OS52]|uniref:hypothetical protein n=1 Tax=Tessaracoccus sp. OS52 TaxID=2886691 RepID=UPI001D124368|nr:hypothetical protein [Tessaracoccus sp. OS52]MCC2594007.1 hypothetical protein [Tessaracoccus sp. OS52]